MTYEDCWKAAFGISIAEIEGADHVVVSDIYNALRQHPGDPRKQAKALLACLGQTGWRWKRFERPPDSAKSYNEMVLYLVGRIEMLAHGLHRQQQLREVADRRPYWKFMAGPHEDTPDKCKALDGTIKHFKDPFWQDHLPPCEHATCRCQVFSLPEQDLARKVASHPDR